MQDLFDAPQTFEPLASRMRPRSLGDFFGQKHLLAPGKLLRRAIEENHLHSMIFWGPPGVGKTTLARLIAEQCDIHFEILSAVFSGVKDVRLVMQQATQRRQRSGRQTLLFVDEIHRFNKAQQDAFLPYVEDGTIIFIGATTENPSFEVNNALLSRARVYVLKSLSDTELLEILQNAIDKGEVQVDGVPIQAETALLQQIAVAADGDARRALNLLEAAAAMLEGPALTEDAIVQVIQGQMKRYDKGGDIFYDQISAFHKSVRGSSPEGALYWYARMLDAGCDPLYIARRLCAIASEDIGNADPRALQIAVNAWDVFERLGPAEGERAIAHAAVYCACAPKSNAIEVAFKAAKKLVRETGSLEVPAHLRNAPTRLMKSLGYGEEYRYAHNEPHAYAAGECYLPPELQDITLYEPTDAGLEGRIKARLENLKSLDEKSPRQRYKNT